MKKIQNMKVSIWLFLLLILSSCSGINPNIGETTVDNHFRYGNYDKAFQALIKPAEAGKPWAQLRLGMLYDSGRGTEEDLVKAEFWFKKAATQKAVGGWAEGQTIGATGKNGFFNQNSDARIAQYHLARMYLHSGKNLAEALKLIEIVIKESKGRPIFLCCEEYYYPSEFITLKKQIEKKLNSPFNEVATP